jgi:CPA1 family monovalent cation:H+ antiporter
MELYRQRIESHSQAGEAATLTRENERIEKELRLAAVKAERGEVYKRLRSRRLGSEAARKLIRELNLLEARYSI